MIGKFKDKAVGKQITHFVGLRAKLYCYKMEGGKEERKCKGVVKSVVKKSIRFEDYKKLYSQKKKN